MASPPKKKMAAKMMMMILLPGDTGYSCMLPINEKKPAHQNYPPFAQADFLDYETVMCADVNFRLLTPFLYIFITDEVVRSSASANASCYPSRFLANVEGFQLFARSE